MLGKKYPYGRYNIAAGLVTQEFAAILTRPLPQFNCWKRLLDRLSLLPRFLDRDVTGDKMKTAPCGKRVLLIHASRCGLIAQPGNVLASAAAVV